jgi:predicted Zn finger-like uncharacterized protein
MKITCQSCQSKYNVADEKVHGKIVKIRCRKCGGTIVVNATAGGANGARAVEEAQVSLAPAQPSMVAAPTSAAGEWHVNLGDNDQRQMSLADLVAAYNAGTVTQDTFIWTDGMDDWRPLAEVEPVVGALHAAAAQAHAPAYAPAASPQPAFEAPVAAPAPAAYPAPAVYEAPAAAYEAPAAAASYGASSFGAQTAPVAEPKRAAVKREPRGRDLFSSHAGEELQTSAAAASVLGAPQVDDGKMTGQRNENSVLFSLAVLTKSGEDRAPDAPPQSKDDSGMIDLKALVARSESARPAARIEGDVFSAPLGIPSAPLASPLGPLGAQGADARPKSKLPLLIGAGGGMLIIMALGIFIGVKVAGGGSIAPLPSAAPSVAPVASASASAEPSASAASPDSSASPSASVAASAPKPKAAATGGAAWHPPAGGTKSTSGTSGGATSPPAAGLPPSPAPKKGGGGGDCGCNGDLMCLMKCSTH